MKPGQHPKSVPRESHSTPAQRAFPKLTRNELFALAFGLFLGLALLKFGNPIILQDVVFKPASFGDLWHGAWPPMWGVGLLILVVAAGWALAISNRARWPARRWLWVLPVFWFGWQIVAAGGTVDGRLTTLALWQFAGVVGCYVIAALTLNTERALRLLLVGLIAAFALCTIRAVRQKLVEFPREQRMLLEGQRTGWADVPPGLLRQMRNDGVLVQTNGVEVVNPALLGKYARGRVHGTLIYPNALAGAVLLLFPATMAVIFAATREFRGWIRWLTFAVALFLGTGALVWSGSKSGWLIALLMLGLWLFRLRWSARWKLIAVGLVVAVGLTLFTLRFRDYLATGAGSAGARLDYWRVALRITGEEPLMGTGPGTFQRPYSQMKEPGAEMTRLVHNDYLEQFSDSGLPGGVAYGLWIGALVWVLGRSVWRGSSLRFALFVGLAGVWVQGFSEFNLYIPALAWSTFALAGALLATGNRVDKPATPR